ncbi:unnamed protein product, partial [Prorocentrum cordatum]
RSRGVRRVELPRLRLSFTRSGKRLYCDQHSGKWLSDRACPESVEHLVGQWGGGTVLLEDVAGAFVVLVSAVAEPIRPADHHGDLGAVEQYLPLQLVLRRGAKSWVSNLVEGSRHYYYPLHLSGTLSFTPTPAASFYLLLCRFLTWHFSEVAAMASAISEVSTSEERQLWARLNLLETDFHADAVACRLRIILAAIPYGASAIPPWHKGVQLLEYARKRHLVSAGCAISLQQEMTLLALQEARDYAEREAPELLVRRAVVANLVAAEQWDATPGVVTPTSAAAPVLLGPLVDDSGFDKVFDNSFLREEGFMERISASVKGMVYNRPEGESAALDGVSALAYMDQLLPKAGGLAAVSLPIFLLYEMFTGTIHVNLVRGDETPLLASALLRVMMASKSNSPSPQLAVLRALEANDDVRHSMPQWGSEGTKRTMKLGGLVKFDHDSASRLMKMAMENLREKEASLRRPAHYEPLEPPARCVMVEVQDARSPRYWAPPITSNVLNNSRAFRASLGAEFGDRPLAEVVRGYVVPAEGEELMAGGA